MPVVHNNGSVWRAAPLPCRVRDRSHRIEVYQHFRERDPTVEGGEVRYNWQGAHVEIYPPNQEIGEALVGASWPEIDPTRTSITYRAFSHTVVRVVLDDSIHALAEAIAQRWPLELVVVMPGDTF